MPEEGARDADLGPVGALAAPPVHGGEGGLVDDDLVVAGLDEAAGDVLDLLAGLDEEVVAGRDLDGDAGARVAGPDVEARVSRAAVDGEEVEVGVEAGEDGVAGAVAVEVGGGGREEVRPVGASRGEGVLLEAQAQGRHLGELADGVLHGGAPRVHGGRPPVADVVGLGDDVVGVEAGELGLVRRGVAHAPKEAALGVGRVARDVEGPLVGGEPLDDVEARLVDGALGLLGVVEGDADLVAQLRPLVFAQGVDGLGEVVLEQVEEAVVGLGGHAAVVQDEGAVGDEGVGGPGALCLDGGRRGRVGEEEVEVDDGEVHVGVGSHRGRPAVSRSVAAWSDGGSVRRECQGGFREKK